MSYLFDLFLIQRLLNKDQILGVIIADYIKYSRRMKYDPLVEQGIRFQIQMELFIKNHPSFLASKRRIDPRYTRFSNEIVKIYYSHFLAANWENYSKTELVTSLSNVYVNLTEGWQYTPKKLKKMIPILLSSPGINGMKTIGGIHGFIDAVSRKGCCVGYLQNTLLDLVNNYNVFKEDFETFMKDFQEFAIQVQKEDARAAEQDYQFLATAS